MGRSVRIFTIAAGIGALLVVAVVAFFALDRGGATPVTHTLVDGVSIGEQLHPDDVAALRRAGFRSVVDLRPDGEAADQPSSDAVKAAAERASLYFAYVPVSHGAIADDAVGALARALAQAPRPVLLYCRSGRRAARTWALVEASRPNGLDAVGIAAALTSAGQSVDDIEAPIAQRIAARTP